MSKPSKKQTLLTNQKPRIKPSIKAKQRHQPRSTAPTASNNPNTLTINENSKAKKAKLIVLLILLVLLISCPKPTLLSYKKLNMVSESIYWPGLFGHGGMLIDSHLYPQFDSDRNTLYLCSSKSNLNQCQKYQVLANKGFFAAVKKYIID